MAKNSINVYIFIIFLIVGILFICLRKQYDAFENSVPESCGKYGYFPIKYFKALASLSEDNKGQNTDIFNNIERWYSEADCKTLGGITVNDVGCYLLKDVEKDKNGKYNTTEKNIKKNFSQVCKGLNQTSMPPPKECSVGGKLLGKPSAEFKLNKRNGTATIDKNTLRVYTLDECNQLKGQFLGSKSFPFDEWAEMLQKNVDESKYDVIITDDDINRISKSNGVEYGICGRQNKPMNQSYSVMCTDPADDPLMSQVFSVAKSTSGIQDIGKAVIKIIQEQLHV